VVVTRLVGRPGTGEGSTDIPPELGRRFEAVVFDWDGTAVPDRKAEATELRSLVEALCAASVHIVVISGTNVDNVDGQLRARPAGPGRLYLCLDRGSQQFGVDHRGVHVVARRRATRREDEALDTAAQAAVGRLAERGLRAEIVSARLNRRKIDLIPEPEWSDPPKARIEDLLEAVEARLHAAGIAGGLSEVVEIAHASAAEAGLPHARVTSDAKHVEIGLTDKSDSARWAFRMLRASGIAPARVLVVGDEFGSLGGSPGSDTLMLVPEGAGAPAVSVGIEPEGVPDGVVALGGGPPRFLDVLRDQLARRARREVPVADPDPMWTIEVDGVDPTMERVNETLLTIADGRLGTSGSPLAIHPDTTPNVAAAGVYDGSGSQTGLVSCPQWAQLSRWLNPSDSVRRVLELRTGLLFESIRTDDEGAVTSVRFSSLARPGLAVLRARGAPAMIAPAPAPVLPPGVAGRQGTTDGLRWARQETPSGGVVTAIRDEIREWDGTGVLDRLAAYSADPDRKPRQRVALSRLQLAGEAGFDRLLMEHREAWARRWEDAAIQVEGDRKLQHALRFCLFHLMASVADTGEAAVGARGLSGTAYRGHVFWDSDVFVVPFLAATHPRAARAMLEYRIRRLPAALAIARAAGRAGARFPWESAATGSDVTPASARDRTGAVVPIRTGRLEEHIVADVAWAAACYEDWTGDLAFGTGPGANLLFETARYWASRVRWDRSGNAHIYGVIGPDEYHDSVDDNAFTNVMARWNLRRAAARAAEDARVPAFERLQWLEIAGALVDGFHADTGLYEQFAGFFDLEPLVIADVAPKRPIAADLLLGPDRVHGAQIIKQADVLMLHHLVPDEVDPASLVANLEFYEPRTAHGSSLSPGVHAALLARAGLLDPAMRALDIASRLDLDDLTGTTARGLHLATMGSVWQAIVFGFAGIRPVDGTLRVDPHVPAAWGTLEVRLKFRDSGVRVRMGPDTAEIHADPPIRVAVGDLEPALVPQAGRRWRSSAGRWEEMER
jgi:trehalose/maltose hydrolase-like predicted phosphorylase